ncbi:MAG: chromosome segregation protein SMC, partial [Clostridia bacterium]|nr:chromosome segregation protein SMC [Clostridia bacterium]
VGMEQSTSAKQLFETKINNLEEQIVRSENEIEKNREIIANAIKTKEDNQNLINESNKLLEELTKKYQDLEKRIKVINEKITLGEEIAQESRKRIIESIENLSDFKVSKGTFSAEKQKLTEKINELNAELDALSVKRDNQFNEKEKIDKKIDELDRSIFELKNKITAKEDEVRSGNDNVSSVENKIFSLNTTITALETKEHFYKGLKENYDGYGMVVKSLMIKSKDNPELKKRIRGVVAELIKIDKKFDVAIETALSASAQNIVTANEDDAKYLINYLKVNKLGRITFLPITSVRPRNTVDSIVLALREDGALGIANEIVSYDSQYENIISNLLGNTLVVDNLDNATAIAKRYLFEFRIVTLDGDLLSNQGAMTGGSRRFDTPSLLSNDRRIEEVSAELKEKRAEMEKLQKEKETLANKSEAYYDELSVLNDLYTNKRQELSVEREKQMSTEKTLSEIGRDIEATSDLIEDFNAKLLKASEDFEHIAKGGEKLEESKNSATLDADKKQAEYDALRKERESLSDEGTEIQINITEIKGKISSIIADNERLSNESQESEKNIKHLEESIDGAKGIIEGFKKEEEKIALTKEEQDYVNGIRDKISKIDEDKEKLRERLSLIEKKREELNNELTELSEKKHSQEIALTEIDSDLKHMGESILEDYQETYETALAFKAENYDEKFGVSEISRIRKKRSALGAINANAIDECKILRERYDEMTTQKEDLEKAEKDLNEAIDKIKGEMLVQFDEGFNKINENFQKIFKELFGGGRAMLQMDYTEVDDKLEAGVEIVAEPPGKKLQKLSLLSGGEKALTAIAILFAILRLRPMPFCVLDEIEAALDEANVDRFARYLQKFSEETQFIVITHRKPTMEMADALFGVTMQEKGVSKTVSVKLSDISDFDGDAV